MTASLNMEKDMSKTWKLTKNLNNDNPTHARTVLEHSNELKTGKAAANLFADRYQQESTVNMPRKRIKEVRNETRTLLTEPPTPTESCLSKPFTMKELNQALQKVKPKKAPGPDGITGHMLIVEERIAQRCAWRELLYFFFAACR